MNRHPCRGCSSRAKDQRDPAYSCEGCTKPDDYADYVDQEHDRKRDDEMIEAEEKEEADAIR